MNQRPPKSLADYLFLCGVQRTQPAFGRPAEKLLRANPETPRAAMDEKHLLQIGLTDWVECGAPRIVVEDKLAAALACSRLAPDVQWKHPWNNYLIQWGETTYHVYANAYRDSSSLGDVPQTPLTTSTEIAILSGWRPSIPRIESYFVMEMKDDDLVRDTEDFDRVGVRYDESLRLTPYSGATSADQHLGPDDPALRYYKVAARLIVGVCLMFNEAKAIGKGHNSGSSARPARDGEPTFRTYQLSKPVSIDCRQSVRDYLAGETSRTVKVQWMVRGHWRNQAYGPAMSLRRPTWIEPHWQGKADAPIALRPHTIKKPEDNS